MNILLLLCFCGLVLVSCRTNDIARYSLHNSVVLYRTSVAGDAAEAHLHIDNPHPFGRHDPVTDILTGIGEGIAGAEAQKKLSRAIDPDSLAMSLTAGVRTAVETYFNTHTAHSRADSPAYIIEVQLTDYELHSGDNGIYARVCGETRILQAGTARLLWENSESVTIPLRRTHGAALLGGAVGTATSIYNASELLGMDDSALRDIMNAAAAEAGRDIGEQLRDDAVQ